MLHSMGGFGMTPNVFAQLSAKVAMTARFLGFVGSVIFGTTVMVPKPKCARPCHLDFTSLDSTTTRIQKARRKL
jgi:hypothetical protein